MVARRFGAYFNEPSGQKKLFYFLCVLYVGGTSLVVILAEFLPFPCVDEEHLSELEFKNVLYKYSECDNIRYPILLFLTKTECIRGRHLLMAVFLGSLIGYERRSDDRPAGIRTMALVSLGSALFTINSTFGFLAGPMSWDASRVSAAIPSGVGFLGAGLIVKSNEVDPVTGERHHLVQGITTAAATWLSAAVGIACGGGMYFVAAFSTALNLMLLRFGPRGGDSSDNGSLPSRPILKTEWSNLVGKDIEAGDKESDRIPYGGTEAYQNLKSNEPKQNNSRRNRAILM